MIKIDTPELHYVFQHHVNIVGGNSDDFLDSGQHKTHVYSLLYNANVIGNLESNKKLVFIDNVQNVEFLTLDSETCVVIDEANFKPNHIDLLLIKVRDVNAYLIVFGRLLIKQLECSVDGLYVINDDLSISLKTEKPGFNGSIKLI